VGKIFMYESCKEYCTAAGVYIFFGCCRTYLRFVRSKRKIANGFIICFCGQSQKDKGIEFITKTRYTNVGQ